MIQIIEQIVSYLCTCMNNTINFLRYFQKKFPISYVSYKYDLKIDL